MREVLHLTIMQEVARLADTPNVIASPAPIPLIYKAGLRPWS
jgi:hypothetical protein